MKHSMKSIALLAFGFALSLSSLAQGMHADSGMKPGGMDESKMMEMCQKMHSGMTEDQCREMRQKMMSGHGQGGHPADAKSGHDHAAQANPAGEPGEAAKVVRTVRISMNDKFRYSPARLTVKQGQTIRFIVKNVGKVKHEIVFGTSNYIAEHNELMQKNPGMEHEEPHMISLEPGSKGELIWRFTQPGKFVFACLEPGHLAAGMKGTITVLKATAAEKASPAPDASAHKH